MTLLKRSGRAKKRASLVLLMRFLMQFARLIPYRVSVALGGMLGFAAYYLLPKERKRTGQNLSEVFSGHDRTWVRRTARRTFIHLGKSLLETVSLRPARLGSVVTVRGFDNLRNALAGGRGAVYVTGHIGNWELMAGAVAREFPLSVVAAPLKPEPLNDMIIALRAELGARTIVRSRPGAAKELIRVFRENRVLGILIDQDTDVEGAFVDFFGRKAWTPTAAAQMAIRFNAPVVFGHIHREKDGRHTVNIEGPIEMTRTGDEDRDIEINTAMLTRRIEETILRDPVQWVWMHRRWRRRP